VSGRPRTGTERDLATLLGEEAVRPGDSREYLSDATESRNLRGHAEAIALPGSDEEVAAVMRWCYDHDVPLVPRGGGTGLTGGAVPVDGGIVLSLERIATLDVLEPGLWRAHVQAGCRTADLRRRARESGLFFPPDPGAAEQSMLGGNIATNAGGPHTFKYGVTGTWVTGLDVVLAPGEVVHIGGTVRKDVAGYDLRSLLIGSEGTLGVITGAWLRLIPAPAATLPVVGIYPDAATGCAALESVFASGVVPAALEYLDAATLAASAGAFPTKLPPSPGFMLIAEADGSQAEASAVRTELREAMEPGSVSLQAPDGRRQIDELWRWRAGTSIAVTAQRGGKVSEDIVVPIERLAEAIEATLEIGVRHGVPACSWGHAGDGNLHSSFMIDLDDPAELQRAELAGHELFELAAGLRGSVSGEHGLGWVKRGALAAQWDRRALELHEEIKRLFDPKGLINPGKKVARIGQATQRSTTLAQPTR
jgi:glycolate oxidase subunit GlcD